MGTGVDLRRTDLRTNVLENPYWITSGDLDESYQDVDAVMFTFPVTGTALGPGYGTNLILLHSMVFEVVTGYTSTDTVIIIGYATIGNDNEVVTAVSDVDDNEYFAAGEITEQTPGNYVAGGDVAAIWAARTWAAYATITPHATVIPAVVAAMTKGAGDITTGAGRLHVLISEVPSCR